MFTTLRSPGRRLAAATALLTVTACLADSVGPTETRITRLQAFLCTVRNADLCLSRGDSIPTGTLPPTNEAFQVWAWHPGSNTTVWRLLSSMDSSEATHVGSDSVGDSVILNGAEAKNYTLRILIVGPNKVVLAQDSLRWEFP